MQPSPKKSLGFFTIATNHYVLMLESQLLGVASQIRSFGWNFVVATDQDVHLRKFVSANRLDRHVTIVKCPPYKFPLASMLRFKYMTQLMGGFDFVCYLDCDMKIEDPRRLNDAIVQSRMVNLVRHPGWARDFGQRVDLKEKLSELFIRVWRGGLGDWETRKQSTGWVPRKSRISYFAGGIFFGPNISMNELSRTCDGWMDRDLANGIVASVHDESYLNRWASEHTFTSVGPEFCFTEFAWLPSLKPVVRALDKSSMNFDEGLSEGTGPKNPK